MAVSPLIFAQYDEDPQTARAAKPTQVSTTSSSVKTKSLAVRTGSHDQTTLQIPIASATDSSTELAEQVNEEIRSRYVKGKKVGEGTYAVVYLGTLRSSPSTNVAIKKIKVQTDYADGLNMSAIREVKYLQELSHPNIIALHAVFSSKNQNLNLVLEYLPCGDLEQLIKDVSGIRYSTADIKSWMAMLGRAVWFCHSNYVLHRDIKPNNLLIAADGTVKLADFGLARGIPDPFRVMTPMVITRWYRPPELLFGSRFYSGAVDVWSMGLVFAELVIRTPFVAGETDMAQIDLISRAIGSPIEEIWPGVTKLPDYVRPDPIQTVRQKDFYMATFGTIGSEGVELLMSTLILDPRRRCTAEQFLKHSFWTADPRPTATENLPRKGGGERKMGEDLKRKGGEVEGMSKGKGDKVARKLDFGGALR